MSKKKTNSNVVLYSILAILLIAVIICGVITHGFQNWTVCGCFGHKYDDGKCSRCGADKPADEPESGAVVDNNGNFMDSDKIYSMPAGMVFSSARVNDEETEKSVTIRATIEPADATNKSVDWSVVFANATSEWASGKTVTDYVTVTPTSDGSLTATVTCKQAFGEQVVIHCVAQDNSDVAASCIVDYRKRVENVSVSINGFMSGGFVSGSIRLYTDNAPQAKVSRQVTYSAGTVGGEEEVIVEYKLHDLFYNPMSAHVCMAHDWNTCTNANHFVYHLNQDWHEIGDTLTTDLTFLEPMFKFVPTNYSVAFNDVRSLFKTNERATAIIFRITCADWTKELNYSVNVDNLKIAVTNITLNEGTLEF